MGTRRAIAGLLFLEGVGQGYNVISATNSSPQTTEVFGDERRRRSLMKWVGIGLGQLFAFMALASIIARSWWPLIGGGMVAGVMGWSYRHASRCAERQHGLGLSETAVTPLVSDPDYPGSGDYRRP